MTRKELEAQIAIYESHTTMAEAQLAQAQSEIARLREALAKAEASAWNNAENFENEMKRAVSAEALLAEAKEVITDFLERDGAHGDWLAVSRSEAFLAKLKQGGA